MARGGKYQTEMRCISSYRCSSFNLLNESSVTNLKKKKKNLLEKQLKNHSGLPTARYTHRVTLGYLQLNIYTVTPLPTTGYIHRDTDLSLILLITLFSAGNVYLLLLILLYFY